ncbi:FO synthase subunit 2 [Quadrisphaera granulorum]|uniref:FO synthase subunit 2 n=1 Tax=Quadrisphaera granulorum TaxID=317664 RepID=A0A316A7G7_9ACTN|nr:FO synthase [Quadrisphaera granulorum]PWJ52764.1 FO synthase subunit 2 [Quadrisphaera granulorum]SZE97369.1 FO synthase subunit 2 [Quadrisphaera granulorum]
MSPRHPTGRVRARRAVRSPEELLAFAIVDASSLSDDDWAQLLAIDEPYLDALCGLADARRANVLAAASGHDAPDKGGADGDLTFVVNRNLTTAAVAGPPGSPQAELRDALVDEAVALGATELCVQGPLPPSAAAGEGQDDGYLDLVRALHERAPQLHLHAFRPAEVLDAATRSGRTPREWLTAARDAGLGSVPGTGARILDDALRPRLAPPGAPDLTLQQWVDLITTAHEVGLRSTATLVYGHLETHAQQVAHLRRLQEVQRRTGGFTEFIAMPWTPALTAPLPDLLPAGLPRRRPGPSERETRALHAVARLLLGSGSDRVTGSIDHVQVAWTKLGGGTSPLVEQLLTGGADDLGGLLLDGTVAPDAGAEAGTQLTAADVVVVAEKLGRTPRQRTTTYADVPPDQRLPLPPP